MAETERALSTAELNRALLARQMLLERKRLPALGAGADRRHPGPILALDVRGALDSARGVPAREADPGARAPHCGAGNAAAGDDPPGHPGGLVAVLSRVCRLRRERWLGARKGDPSAKQMEAGTRRLRKRLADGPAERAEVEELVGQGSRGTNGASIWTDLVRVPPSGTWERRRADLFAEAERWIGPEPRVSEAEAMVEAVAATCAASARPGRPRSPIGLGSRSTSVAASARSSSFDASAVPTARSCSTCRGRRCRTPRPRRRCGSCRSGTRPCSPMPAAPRSSPTSTGAGVQLEDPRSRQAPSPWTGRSAGTWRYEKGKVKTEPFGRLDAAARRELNAEAEHLAALPRLARL